MNRTQILDLASDIYSLTETKLFGVAFTLLHKLCNELSLWWATSRCDELEVLCKQMLSYSLGDFEDPERDNIINKLQYDIYVLVDEVVAAIGTKSFSTYDYEQKRIFDLTPIDKNDILKSLCKDDSKIYSEATLNAIDLAFRSIWLMDKINEEDKQYLKELILCDKIWLIAREMSIAALMLKGLRCYDESIWNILISAANDGCLNIRARAILALVLLIEVYDNRIIGSISYEQLHGLFKNEDRSEEIGVAFKFIIKTFSTDKVTKKINTEIYPELMKSSSKLQEMLKEDNGDLMGENGFNPKWEKALDDAGVNDKLRQFNEMQLNGADVYMSTFSGMKGFAFFKEIAHWFMPFDKRQKDVANTLAELPEIMHFFSDSKLICNSDKYSFIYTLSQVPSSNFKSMVSGLGGDIETIREEYKSELWKKSEQNEFAALMRNYVLDLFRFYRLFPKKNDFVNPFDYVGKFTENGFLANVLSLKLKQSICKYLFEAESYEYAKPIFEYLDSQQVWDAYFYQQMGHCYQSLGMWSEAIDSFEKSDLLEPNDVWTLKHKALCYKKTNNIDKAIECYSSAIGLKGNDVAVILNLARCHIIKYNYSEARRLYYQADYLRPYNTKIISELAWCMFLEEDYEEAFKKYDKVVESDKCTENDAINAGHTAWALGEKDKARQYYKKARLIINNDADFVTKMIDDQIYLKKLGLNEDEILILINQVLFL